MMRGYEKHHVDGSRVYRFVRIERLMHWINAVSFFALAATGAILLLRGAFGFSVDSIATIHRWHVYVGAVYFFGPALIFLIGDWRAGVRWTANAFRWTLSEFVWLMGRARKFLPRLREPVVGRFNAGQRLNLLGQIVGKWALAITGYAMHVETGQLLMYNIHVAVFVILLVLVGGHIYMGLVNRSTRHSLNAMLSGFVDVKWLEHHHPAWLENLPRLEQPPAVNTPTPAVSRSLSKPHEAAVRVEADRSKEKAEKQEAKSTTEHARPEPRPEKKKESGK